MTRLRLLLVLTLLVVAGARVAALEIHQTTPITEVYAGDSLNLWSSFSDDLAWWAPGQDPTEDPPDQIVNITNRVAFPISPDLPLGTWYMWNGENERGTTYLFRIVAGPRPVVITPPITIPSTPQGPTVTGASQPLPVADYLLARYSPFNYECPGPCRVWLFGPEAILGEEGGFSRSSMGLLPGNYLLLAQYPDGAGTFEIFYDEGFLNSTWKEVAGVNVKGFPPALILDRLTTLTGDPAHFHGRMEKKTIRLEDPHADILSLEVSETGKPIIRGLTNLPEGATLTVVFDDDHVITQEDRWRNTGNTTAIGPILGALRYWQAMIPVDIQTLAIGNHMVSAYPPRGTKTSVEFYVSSAFEPFPTPVQVIRYIEGSPFLPTPTPVVVEREVPVTVIQTVYVNVTPPYEAVLKAQTEAQAAAMDQFRGTVITAIEWLGAGLVALYLGRHGARYLRGAMKRAREMEVQHGT
jgi:hypothetical protein